MTKDPVPHVGADTNLKLLQWKAMKPIHTEDLVRVGRPGDGGYVISSRVIPLTSWLISLGIETEWSFEAEFLALNSRCQLVGVDGTTGVILHLRKAMSSARDLAVRLMRANHPSAHAAWRLLRSSFPAAIRFPLFWGRPRRMFIKKLIGPEPRSMSVTTWAELREAWPEGANLFIKMDIEGAEYDVLRDIIESGDSILGFAFEFHDLDSRWEEFTNAMTLLMQQYAVVHIHGNNYRGLVPGTSIPSVVEVSFVNKSLLSDIEKNSA